MPIKSLGYQPSRGSDGEAMSVESHDFERARLGFSGAAGVLDPSTRDQLARDIASIERATAALRRAEPALELLDQGPAGDRDAQATPVVAADRGVVAVDGPDHRRRGCRDRQAGLVIIALCRQAPRGDGAAGTCGL